MASDELEDKSSQTRCVSKVNVGWTLSCFQSAPHRPLLAPIYRWPGLKDREGSDTDYNIDIHHELVFRLVLQLGLALMGLRGTQPTGFIIYTLVSSPPRFYQNYRFGSNLKSSNLWLGQSFDFLFFLYSNMNNFHYIYFARGFDEQAWQLWRIKRSVNCRNRYLSPTSNSIPLNLNPGNWSNPFFCRI
jgi:hypothetical protein